MSPLWNKSLSLHIAAQQLQLVVRPGWLQQKGWLGMRATGEQALPAAGLEVSSELTQPVSQAMGALFAAMQQQTDLRRARLRVTLADAHVHYDVVRGDFAGCSTQQLQAIAQGCLTELLGEDAAHQQLRWQLQPDGEHLLLCAMDAALVDAVVQLAAQLGLRLDSVQPAFCQHWNRHRNALPQGNGVFALADAGHSLSVCAQRGSIMALSLGQDRSAQSLDQRVNRLLASLGTQAQVLDAYVLVARDPAALAPTTRWTLRDWQEQPL